MGTVKKLIKIAGAFLVIVSCSGFGFLKALELNKRIVALQNIRKMFVHLRGEISYAKNPFMEAFFNMKDKQNKELSLFCDYMYKQINTYDGKSFHEKWSTGIDKYVSKTGLVSEDIINLKKMGEQLGYLDYNMQLATIDLEMENLENKINTLREESLQKKKVYQCVGVFFGLMLTIILF